MELGAITAGDEIDSGVPGQGALLALVESTVDGRGEELPVARSAVAEELGSAALVDAAAVIGNFQRMTRIADGTGIPLDAPIAAMSADLRDELGINEFGSAAYTPPVGWLKKTLFRAIEPLFLKRISRQMKED